MAKILIVEDDDLMRRLYERVFRFEGFEVEVTSNGRECLERVKTFIPDLIILDIMMPEMNGLEVIDKLKASPTTQSIMIVVLTNLAGTEEAKEALDKGAVKYLIKSEYEPRQIVAIMRDLLAGSQN